ncbi:MAG: 50S ribosomal protein L22, partial [Clostridiales bacterium]|nr:50S ribosomal protein L22 [Clostridiales bacterium]
MREKARARQRNRDERPRAIAKYVRMSPRKVKVVIDLIRG